MRGLFNHHKSKAEKAYMTSLRNADAKGYAASQDPQFSERDNPYSRYEHRQFWIDGFRRGRATLRAKLAQGEA